MRPWPAETPVARTCSVAEVRKTGKVRVREAEVIMP